MSTPLPLGTPRCVGLDVHRQSITVAGVDKEQQMVLRPRRVALGEFMGWAQANLTSTDAVVLEATSNAWTLYDQLQPLVASVTVAHPGKVQGIAGSRVKTDPRDALHLAHLLAAGFIPAVWVPPLPVRELRALLAQRQRLRRQGTRIRNQLQGLLHAHNLPAPLEPLLPKKSGSGGRICRCLSSSASRCARAGRYSSSWSPWWARSMLNCCACPPALRGLPKSPY